MGKTLHSDTPKICEKNFIAVARTASSDGRADGIRGREGGLQLPPLDFEGIKWRTEGERENVLLIAPPPLIF